MHGNSNTDSDSSAISDLISDARTVVGIGPIYQSDFEHFGQIEPGEAIRLAAIEALRLDLNIKDYEIKDSDIENTFLPNKPPKVPRVYIRFYKQEHADLCFKVAKGLKKSETKVFRYFPRQFQARVRALEEIAYPKRKQTDPGFKTEVVYTVNDVQLIICQRGQVRYHPYHVANLPPIDMAPLRSPPPGRPRHKRNRSNTISPEVPKKSSRHQSPQNLAQNDPDNQGTDTTNVSTRVVVSNRAPPPAPLPIFADLGGFSNIQAMSPLTGKMSFNFNTSCKNGQIC